MASRRFVIKLLLLLAICLSGGSVFSFYSLLYEQNDKAEATTILVEKGDSLGGIASQLKKDGLIRNVSVFKMAARLAGNSTRLKAGEYRIPAHASTKMILDILVTGQTVVRRVTIPEGKTSRQIFDLLVQTPGLTGELPPVPPNGALLPETYTFAYGVPRGIIVQRMTESMRKTIDELWPYRDPDLPYTTKHEALTLASIVEKETAVPEERARIAGVFVNRLRKGMRLQTDPTVIYALTEGSMELNRRLTHADLRLSHPYNTYVRKGLPPGPICNPGRDSIQAVLRPQKSNEIYFVADGTGGHVFSVTFDEHKRNIAEWKKTRRRKRAAQLAKRRAPARPSVPQTDTVITTATTVEASDDNSTTITTTLVEDENGVLTDSSELSADIVDDILVEQAAEKPVDPEKAAAAVPAVRKTAPEKKAAVPAARKKAAPKTTSKKAPAAAKAAPKKKAAPKTEKKAVPEKKKPAAAGKTAGKAASSKAVPARKAPVKAPAQKETPEPQKKTAEKAPAKS